MKRHYPPRPETAHRIEVAREMRAAGKSLAEIAAVLGMQWSAVGNLCARYHIPKPRRHAQALKTPLHRRLTPFPGILALAKQMQRAEGIRAYWSPSPRPRRDAA